MIGFASLETRLRNNNFSNNYLVLLSKNVTQTQNIINHYKSMLKFPDLNCIELDGENVQFKDLENCLMKLPFMDNFSLVIVTNANFVTTKGKDTNKVVRPLNKMEVPSHCILILQTYIDEEENPFKNVRLPKLEKKGATVVYSPKFTLQEGITEIEKRNIRLNKNTISYIYEKTGISLDVFINECMKVSMLPLCEGNRISTEALDSVITKTTINSIFEIIDVLVKEKNLIKGFEILNNLLESGTHPLEVFGVLNSQIKLIYYAKQYALKGYNENVFANEIAIHPYRAKIGFQQANMFSEEKISSLFIDCNNAVNKIGRAHV